MNRTTLNIHHDILDEPRKELLEKLIPFTQGFILGGGTALAFQLGHRKSFDFDFFSTSAIKKNLIEKVSSAISVESVIVHSSDELSFLTKENIKVTFLYYPFKHHFELISLENGVKVFSAKDIAIQKAYTIGRRGEYRDYFDLYIILKNNYIRLEELISVSIEIYGSVFNDKIFLQQLVYFGDLLNFEIIPASLTPLPNPDEIKHFFEDLVTKHLNKI